MPWQDVMISGHVLASEKEKISKSKGNSKLDPNTMIETYSSDVIRYWAASGKLGNNIIYTEETLLRGRKLVNKLWNVASFMLMHLEDYKDKDYNNYQYMDKWILGKYQDMYNQFEKYMDNYEFGLGINVLI
jgi:valyl-tRNA synthetase